jgi:hypothetical protein
MGGKCIDARFLADEWLRRGRPCKQATKPLWETTRVVGPEGATIETPDQYGAKVEIAQDTFASITQLRVQVYPGRLQQ